jgi:Na+/melibiose symporter-like transporter
VRAIYVLMGIMLSLLMVGGSIFAFVYPLSREKHMLVREQLAERANLIWSYAVEGGVGLFRRAAHAQTNQQFI